jgi:hypothetical protein
MTEPHFRCSNCGTLYLKSWTDEEAAAEVMEDFPLLEEGTLMTLVCSTCYTNLTLGTSQKLIPFGHGAD